MSQAGVIEAQVEQAVQPVEHEAAPVAVPVPEPANAAATPAEPTAGRADAAAHETEEEFLRKLPPEIGALLVLVGVAGVLLPGLIGTPLLVAGAFVVWPKTFEPMERKFAKICPVAHRKGIEQVKRFIDDLNRRFPDQ